MSRRKTDLRAGMDGYGRWSPRNDGAATQRSDPHKPVALVRDLPANFFAVGRMHDAESFMVIDSKEMLNKRSERSH